LRRRDLDLSIAELALDEFLIASDRNRKLQPHRCQQRPRRNPQLSTPISRELHMTLNMLKMARVSD
jgi:hypothetical protein